MAFQGAMDDTLVRMYQELALGGVAEVLRPEAIESIVRYFDRSKVFNYWGVPTHRADGTKVKAHTRRSTLGLGPLDLDAKKEIVTSLVVSAVWYVGMTPLAELSDRGLQESGFVGYAPDMGGIPYELHILNQWLLHVKRTGKFF